MPRSPERIVLVTGAAGGMGAEVARRLAAVDSHVIVNYRDDAARADSIAAAISNAGGHASTLGGDIFDEAGAAAMIGSVAARFGRLDTVILNASGGIDLGGDAAHARHLNREAQRRLSLLAMPLMPAGGRIVFVTSHKPTSSRTRRCPRVTQWSQRVSTQAKPLCTPCVPSSTATVCTSASCPAT